MEIQIHYAARGEVKIRHATLDQLYTQIRSCKYGKLCNSLMWKICSFADLDSTHPLDDAGKLPVIRFGLTSEGTYTGYVLLSFKSRDRALRENLLRAAGALPQTLMCFRGSSGISVKVVCRFTLPDGSLPLGMGSETQYFHQHAYYVAAKFYTAELGLEPDLKSPRVDLGCRISADEGVYLNTSALPVVIEQPDQPLTASVQGARPPLYSLHVNKSLPGYDESMMAQTKFQFCLQKARNESACDGDDADLFVMNLAANCRRNGLEQEFAVKRLLHITPFMKMEMLVRGCFNNAYQTGKGGTECAIPEPSIVMAQLRDFLGRRYQFRRNSITSRLEFVEEGRYMFDWSPLSKEALNRITIDALTEGIVVWDKDVRRFVESTYVPDYDPVHDYLNTLPAWDGTDRLTPLAERVPTGCTGWTGYFHRWMLSMVSQWMGLNRTHGSTMVPLIVGAQGDGKSTFCRQLLPEELRLYYTDRLDFANKNEAERALSRFCLINIDEFDSITRRQTAFLKHILQKTSVMSRRLYSSVVDDNMRYSAFIATTNDMTPLTDPSGSRRYLCVRTAGQIDTRSPYDYPQIYAQLKQELQQGMRSWFDAADEKAIQGQNRDFEQYDLLQEVFNELYRKPKSGEEGMYLSVSAILHRMRADYKSLKEDTSTFQRLGRYLKRQNFKNRKKRNGSEYYVCMNGE